MATIKRTDRGQVVRHAYGYYYLADDLGNPTSHGWIDRERAEAALDHEEATLADLIYDVELDGRGNPYRADNRFARVLADVENDGLDEDAGVDFWASLRAFLQASPEGWDDQIRAMTDTAGPDAIWIPVAEAKRLEAACKGIDGWEGGPEFAPHPLLFYYPEEVAR